MEGTNVGFFEQLGQAILANPVWSVGLVLLVIFLIRFGIKLFHYLHMVLVASKHLVHLKISLPREESPKDKEKSEEKDFKEKIAVMEQFFRNIHELSELSLSNIIHTRLFKDDIVSFEYVAKNKVVDFYVVVQKRYVELLDKQITSYYPHADIQPVDPVELKPKGNVLKCYYAYQKNPFFYPIKTYKTLENDPLNDITNIFSKFEDDDAASIQVLVRPKQAKKFKKKVEEAGTSMFAGKKPGGIKIPLVGPIINFISMIITGDVSEAKKEESGGPYGGGGYVRMLATREEIAKQIGEKAGHVPFDCMIRIIGSSNTKSRATDITNNVALALNLFKDPQMNWFQTRRVLPFDGINNKIIKFNFDKRLLYTKLSLIGEKLSVLDAQELASIFHFPSSRFNYTPIINWLKYKILPAPVDAPILKDPKDGVTLGNNVYRGEKKLVAILRKDRTRHHYCIGKSGSGKSAFLSWMARQDMANGDGVCVVDPHGDLIEELVQFVPKERAKDVIVFNPADTERPMGLNILEAYTPEEMDLASSQATEIFIKIFGDEIFGPRIQHYFRNGCLTLMEDPEEGATLIDVPRIFVDEEFMKYKVSKVKNPVVRSFWEHEFANTGDRERQEMIPYFSSKFGPFITNSIMRNTIGQTKSAFNFRKAMDEQKILLINLSKGKMGDLNTQLLGLVVVARLQMAAMSRVDMPESERKDFYLYVDEFQNFATDSFASILSEARKYHLALIMAHQYIKQLEKRQDTSIRDAVFGNVGTMMSFKIGADDAEYMAKEYAPVLTEQDVIGIANYKAYIKLNINNTTSRPFSLETIYDMSKANPKIGEIIKQYSRMKYGRKREFVDQEISARIGIDIS